MTFAGQVEAAIIVPSTGNTQSITRTTLGASTLTLAAGTYLGITAFCAYLKTALDTQVPVNGGGTWTVSVSTGASGTGKVTLSVSSGTFTINWTNTNLETLLGFTSNVAAAASSTGASQARGLWIPDVPLVSDIDLEQAPIDTDARTTQSPTGVIYAKYGTRFYRHTGLVWDRVSSDRVWINKETTVNASYQRFWLDAIQGLGHSWFELNSRLKIVDHRSIAAGSSDPLAGSVSSWRLSRIPPITAIKMSKRGFVGQLLIEWPDIVGES